MSGLLAPYPIKTRLTTPNGTLDPFWETWVRDLLAAVNAAPFQVAHVFEPSLSASVTAAVAYQTPLRVSAVYWVTQVMRVTQAATVSSDLTFTLGWTAGGVAQSLPQAILSGNTTTTHQQGVLAIRADPNTPITYTVAYTSVGATAMTYELDVCISQLPEGPQP